MMFYLLTGAESEWGDPLASTFFFNGDVFPVTRPPPPRTKPVPFGRSSDFRRMLSGLSAVTRSSLKDFSSGWSAVF